MGSKNRRNRFAPPFSLMDHDSITRMFDRVMRLAQSNFPEDTAIVILAQEGGSDVAQYVSNCHRNDSIALMRDTAERLATGRVDHRVGGDDDTGPLSRREKEILEVARTTFLALVTVKTALASGKSPEELLANADLWRIEEIVSNVVARHTKKETHEQPRANPEER